MEDNLHKNTLTSVRLLLQARGRTEDELGFRAQSQRVPS